MSLELDSVDPVAARVHRPPDGAVRRFLDANRASIGTLAVFVAMIAVFMFASPRVFLSWPIYNSVLVTLPVALCLVVPLVFIVTVGEIDLSFPATMGFSAWIFALRVRRVVPASPIGTAPGKEASMNRDERLSFLMSHKSSESAPFVPSGDLKAPLVGIETPRARRALANIMKEAGFTEAQIERRLAALADGVRS